MKIDLGCGPNKKAGFIGVDKTAFDNVDVVADLTERWPFEDGTVDEVHSSHFVEHLSPVQRVHFVNELYRVLKPCERVNGNLTKGFATIIVPHWASCRAYGDPTHDPMPMSEFWFYYLSKDWRSTNAPHTDIKYWDKGFNCDFEATWGYSVHPIVQTRNQEFQQFAFQFYKEAIQDMIATLIKK